MFKKILLGLVVLSGFLVPSMSRADPYTYRGYYNYPTVVTHQWYMPWRYNAAYQRQLNRIRRLERNTGYRYYEYFGPSSYSRF